MLDAARALLRTTTKDERDVTVEILTPGIDTNPYLPGETTIDWANPIVVARTEGNLQPASTKALERTGRIGKVGVYDLHTNPVQVEPEGRVRIQGQLYRVLDARILPTHSELVVETVSIRAQAPPPSESG